MNIHVLTPNLRENVTWLPDVWVESDLREVAQIGGTAVHLALGTDKATQLAVCRPHNPNGHFVKWALEGAENWLWLRTYGRALAKEYYFRFGKEHGITDRVMALPASLGLPQRGGLTRFASAFGAFTPSADAPVHIQYRQYLVYRANNGLTMFWTQRPLPPFLDDSNRRRRTR